MTYFYINICLYNISLVSRIYESLLLKCSSNKKHGYPILLYNICVNFCYIYMTNSFET